MLLLIVSSLFSSSCKNRTAKQSSGDMLQPSEKIEVSISGMTCTGCEQTIQANVAKLDGINSVRADFKSGKAIIDFNSSLADTAEIRAAIIGSGYGVNGFGAVTASDSVK